MNDAPCPNILLQNPFQETEYQSSTASVMSFVQQSESLTTVPDESEVKRLLPG